MRVRAVTSIAVQWHRRCDGEVLALEREPGLRRIRGLRRAVLRGRGPVALVVVCGLVALATSAGAATGRPLVFKTELTWTRALSFVAIWSGTGLECRGESRLVARSAAFYTAPSRAPRNGHVRFGRTPNAQAMLSGRGYREGSLRVPGSATLEIAETRCNDGRVDRRCAGVFRAALLVAQIFLASDAETHGSTLGWAHEAPQPPTPMPPQVCLSAADPVAVVGGGAMSLFFTQGFDGHAGQFQKVPFPRDLLLTRSTITTHAEKNDFVSPPFEMRDLHAISRTTATFQRVR